MLTLSRAQAEVMRFAADPNRSVVYVVGPTQSGKSLAVAASLVAYIVVHKWSADMDGFAILCPQMTQVHAMLRNVEAMADQLSARCTIRGDGTADLYGYRVFGRAIANRGSRRTFWGLRLGTIVVDEATLVDRETYEYATGRVNRAPIGHGTGKLFVTTNPDSPHHWLKTAHIVRYPEILITIGMEANPSLTEEFRQGLKERWVGAIRELIVYGRWAAHSGLVYPSFEECVTDVIPSQPPDHWDVSIDHATATVKHALLWGVWQDVRVVVDEWRHNGAEQVWLSTGEQSKRLREWVGSREVRSVWVEPAAAHMMVDLAQWFGGVASARNEVLPGIQQCQILMERVSVQVYCSCVETIRELGAYSWDPNAEALGDADRPVKRDAPDAFRYYLHSEAKQSPIAVYDM